jgi:glycosyltransferase involved in cell wall biosynthesis
MNNNELPFVSIIVPTLNSAETVERAIKAIFQQTYPRDKYEVVVVDGFSIDKTLDILSKFPVKLIMQEKAKYPGDSGARNQGFLNSKGSIIVTTDSDDVVDQQWLEQLVKVYSDPSVDFVVGSSHTAYDSANWQERVISELIITMRGSNKVDRIFNNNGDLKTNIGVGPNQSFRREVFQTIGGYDMHLLSGMDLDIIWRAEKLGFRCGFADKAIVYKYSRVSLRKYVRQVYSRSMGGVSIYLKHKDKLTLLYILHMMYIYSLMLLIALNVIQPMNNIILTILLAPVLYVMLITLRAREYILKRSDYIFVILCGYVTTIMSSAGLIQGIYYYLFSYNGEKLLTTQK